MLFSPFSVEFFSDFFPIFEIFPPIFFLQFAPSRHILSPPPPKKKKKKKKTIPHGSPTAVNYNK